ncbi:hypothetical protein, conserved [Eimeria acervulina]|uniref:Uncharacterized protein n=1 Tax=Eimeria acervulina TaxID=5801 RepID=U6GC20_EIMAC|nr:hypothetical protein, conserved [Eimeria acervulina]CDI77062.1 hypothetical protein, conserved [Eimeria acervulina]
MQQQAQQQQLQQQQQQMQQQQQQQPSPSPDELLEDLWAGAGGLQGYVALTKPLLNQQQQQQQQQDEQQQEGEDGVFTEQDTETNFYSLASLFFHERSAQQLQQLQKPLKEVESLLAPLSCFISFFERMQEKKRHLSCSHQALLHSSSGVKGALNYLLQRQTQAEALVRLLEQRLKYYTQLDALQQQQQQQQQQQHSSAPVLSLLGLGGCSTIEFAAVNKTLDTAEEGIQFFASHLDYKDQEQQQQQQQQQQQEEGFDFAVLHVQFEVLLHPTLFATRLLADKQTKGLSDAYARTLQQLKEHYRDVRLRLLLPPLRRQLQVSSETVQQQEETVERGSNRKTNR